MEETMLRLSRNKILLAVLIVTAELMIFGFSDVSAQEKKRFSESNAAANTKYTLQHAIDVGDVAGHQVRIYELHYTWPSNPPVYEGIRGVEGWARGRQWAFRRLLHRGHGEWRQNILSLRGDSPGRPERRWGDEEDVPRRADDCWGYGQIQRYQANCQEHGDLRSESGTQRGARGGRILDREVKGRPFER